MAGTDKAREAAMAQAEQTKHAPEKAGGKTIHTYLEEQKAQIARALPSTMTAERFTRIVWTTVRNNRALMECEPGSLMAAVMLSAQLGLEPGPLGHCYFVPFKSNGVPQVTFIVGYKGLIDLARRSGEIKSIEAREVRANDDFDFEYGLDPKLRHRPAEGDRGDLTHVYGIAHFKDGGHYFEVLPIAEVEKYRDRSKAKNSGPWQTDYVAMARKTVIRRMAPYLPLSTEAARAVEADEGIVANLPVDGDVEIEREPIDVEAVQPDAAGDGEAS